MPPKTWTITYTDDGTTREGLTHDEALREMARLVYGLDLPEAPRVAARDSERVAVEERVPVAA